MRIEILFACLIGALLVISGAAPSSASTPDPGSLPIQQNDAGSGQDAPGEPIPEVWIEPGVVYEGTLAVVGHSPLIHDLNDYYAFWGEQGDIVDAKARGIMGCYEIANENGERLEGSCTLAGWDAIYPQDQDNPVTGGAFDAITLESTGIHYFHYAYFVPQQYGFSIGINQQAPEPGLEGQPLPPLPPV